VTARAEIENGIYRYAWAFDENDMNLLADCFTENAELIEPNGNTVQGRDAIREAFRTRRDSRVERGEQPRHVTTNVLILDESDGRADVRSYFSMHATKDGAVQGTSLGIYVDTWVDDGGTWRISRRQMQSEGRA
jgi:ketosteroid isomerase-like protein